MKPNLLFINSITIYGGGEVWMITAMKEFRKRGYDVTLICKPEAEIIKHAKAEDLDIIPVDIGGDLNPITISELYRIFKNKNIKIVFANTGKDLRLGGLAALFLKDIKVIARQGVDYPLKNNFRYKIAYDSLAGEIVANSEATKQTMLNSAPWLKPDKIKVIYNGIDPAIYKSENLKDLRNEFGFAKDNFVIGFVGRLSVQKGVQYALEAFKSIYENYPNLRLLICGDGELRTDVEKFISKNKLESKIHLAGFRNDIPNIMKTIDVLLTPSLWEGFGIVLIEAMASGKPCIATNTSSIPEIVEDGANGFLVTPKDFQAISESLIKIISDNQLVHKMGQAGIETVKKKFTIEKMIKEYERLF